MKNDTLVALLYSKGCGIRVCVVVCHERGTGLKLST